MNKENFLTLTSHKNTIRTGQQNWCSSVLYKNTQDC